MFFSSAKFKEQTDSDETKGIFSQERRRNFTATIVPSPDANDTRRDGLKGDAFVPEQSYFSVRLVEMRMSKAGNYLSKYLPMCSCFLSYRYGDSLRHVPYIAGHQMIRDLLGKDAPADAGRNIEFKDLYIVRDVPVKSDSVTMYTALSRVSDSSFTRGMLDLFSETVGALGGPALGLAVTTGVDLTKKLGAILGSDDVSTRFGMFNGDALTTSGYRIFAGADLDTTDLEMSNGGLMRTGSDGQPKHIDDADYLVIALEHRKTLLDQPFGALGHLPFHAKWKETVDKLMAKDPAGANEMVRQMAITLKNSPDIVEADKIELLITYLSQLERWNAVANTLPVFRSGGKKLSGSLHDIADHLEDEG
ncbi:hypothetical protein, partial [Caballeronia sp.]|uniref:hypothetical protein n=1 Tax=Caballeronia sp. TaxID=1931223 RepID=UPI003C340D72